MGKSWKDNRYDTNRENRMHKGNTKGRNNQRQVLREWEHDEPIDVNMLDDYTEDYLEESEG